MMKLIIDAAKDKIFLKVIFNNKEYINTHDNSRENFDSFVKIIFDFFDRNSLDIRKLNEIFINQGPGKYSSIRSSISFVKGLKCTTKVMIYGFYSEQIIDENYENLPILLKDGKLTKNLIKPKYLS